MAAQISTRIKSHRAHLRRLSVVFAIELRLKIVTELYKRDMSPTQFYDEFGGGSPSRVARSFQKLVEHGWLRYVRSAPARNGRGKEHFYRAPELAFFDAETWALVPYSMRVAASWNILNEIGPRLRQAIEAANLTTGPRHDLVCLQPRLDSVAWANVVNAIDAQFVSLFEEQEDARRRVEISGEELMRADVFLIAFETATPGSGRIDPQIVESRREPLIPFHERLAPVFADEICMQIVTELNRRSMSPQQFYREFGGPNRSAIYSRFKRLKKSGWLEKVGEGKRRGASEYFYAATRPAICNNPPWAEVSDLTAETANGRALKGFTPQITRSMAAGNFDARKDRYFTWSFLSLDRQGWQKVIIGLEELSTFISREQVNALERIDVSGEKPIRMMVAMAAFDAPQSVKAP